VRNGERKTLTVTIGELSDDELSAGGPTHCADEVGLTEQAWTPHLAERLHARLGEGVVVT
jgi:hypothetical protein